MTTFLNYATIVITIIVGFLSISACSSRKHVPAAVHPLVAHNLTSFNAARLLASPDFTYFSAQGKIILAIDGHENTLSTQIRIHKDHIIWISITVFAGIEVARAMITPDSIGVVSRIPYQYTKTSFDYLNQYTGGTINFKTLQALLTGTNPSQFSFSAGSFKSQDSLYFLSGKTDLLNYQFQYNWAYQIQQLNLSKVQEQGSAIEVTYDTSSFDRKFPTNIVVSIQAEKAVNMQLKLHRIVIDQPLLFPFP